MSVAYVPPGVTIQELTSPSITPLLALPGSLCLVGLSQGYIQRTDLIQLSGTTAVTLPGVPTGAVMTSQSITAVMDAVNPGVAPSGFSSSTDYTFTPSTYQIVRQVTSSTLNAGITAGANTFTLAAGPVPSTGQVVNLGTELITVQSVAGQIVTSTTPLLFNHSNGAAVSWGNIPDGDQIFVSYTYVPSDYWQPIRLNDMADIQNRFGSAWDTTNTAIQTPLSYAAQVAFENGASNIVLQPLYYTSSGVQQQPNDTQAAQASTWQTVFNSLLSLEDINIVVPVVGQSMANVTDAVQLQIVEVVQDFIYNMKTANGIFIIGILGEDSTTSTIGGPLAQEATLQAHAQTLANRYGNAVTQQLVFVNTANFSRANAQSSFNVGGQYMATALGGMLASRDPSATLSRQAVAGFLSVVDTRTKAQKNADAGLGMMVVESKGNVVQVRHAITLDTTSVATRELNVVRGKHFVIGSVQNTLDTQVVAKVVADADAPTLVNNVIIGILEELRGLGQISNYANVASRITSIDPTAMEVRFSYQPIFYVNYITVIFSLDLTTGAIQLTSVGSSTLSATS